MKRIIENFDIAQICDSGQCFRMKQKEDGVYRIIAFGRYLEVEQKGRECIFHCQEAEFEEFWKTYFDLDEDYAAYIGQIHPNDEYLREAAAFGCGIRILRQDLWEMLVTSLITQQNNIVRIRRCIGNICEKYGEERKNFRGEAYRVFPTPKSMAGLDEDALKDCNLGYRSKYVVRAARHVTEGKIDLEAIRRMPYKKAKEALLQIFGVGDKGQTVSAFSGFITCRLFP